MISIHLYYAILLLLIFCISPAPGWGDELHWYKGCLHCHSTVSDGDSTPEQVAAWYRAHGYQFIALTDHNRFTDVNRAGLNRSPDFLVIGGEEVTMKCGNHPVHVNGINIRHLVHPAQGRTVQELITASVASIREAGGIAQINHPFYLGRITEIEMSVLEGFFLMEVHNAMVSTGAEHEMVMDRLTHMGKYVYGTAGDDAHYYKPKKNKYGTPGQGWIMVRAGALTLENIMGSLEKGDFYSSSGVILSDLTITDSDYRVEVVPEKDTVYTITFKAGELAVLQQSTGPSATYHITGKEPYVRCKVESSRGSLALTQPHLISLKRK